MWGYTSIRIYMDDPSKLTLNSSASHGIVLEQLALISQTVCSTTYMCCNWHRFQDVEWIVINFMTGLNSLIKMFMCLLTNQLNHILELLYINSKCRGNGHESVYLVHCKQSFQLYCAGVELWEELKITKAHQQLRNNSLSYQPNTILHRCSNTENEWKDIGNHNLCTRFHATLISCRLSHSR